jgi:hypothetical protein
MAVGQATSMLIVPPSSRASPLPQWSVSFAKFVYVANPFVGVGLRLTDWHFWGYGTRLIQGAPNNIVQ